MTDQERLERSIQRLFEMNLEGKNTAPIVFSRGCDGKTYVDFFYTGPIEVPEPLLKDVREMLTDLFFKLGGFPEEFFEEEEEANAKNRT